MATSGSGEQLTEIVTQMKSTIEQSFVPTMNELQSKFDTEIQRVHDWLNDISEALKEAKPLIEEGFQSATQALDQAEQGVKQDMDQCAQSITAFVAHVHESQAHTQELLTTSTAHAADVVDKLHQAEDLHGTVQDQISQHLGEWSGNVEQAIGTLNEHHNQVNDAFHALTDQANTHVTDLTSALGNAGQLVSQHVAQAAEQHTGNVNELVSQQRDHLVSAVGEALGGHIGETIGAVQGFMQTGESLGQAFDGGLGEILGKVEELGHLLDTIKPVIELAKAIG